MGELTCSTCTRTAGLKRGARRLGLHEKCANPIICCRACVCGVSSPSGAERSLCKDNRQLGLLYLLCCACGIKVLRSGCDPTADFGLEHGQGETNKGCYSIFVYGLSIQEARSLPPAVVVRPLFCYVPFCFQGRIKKIYSLIRSCQLYGKKAGRQTAACRGP